MPRLVRFVAGVVLILSAINCGHVPSQTGQQAASSVRSSSPVETPSPTVSLCSSQGPSPRTYVGAAYDQLHRVTVVFGGDLYPTPTTSTASTSETWIFDGHCWDQLHPATTPSARSVRDGMVFDPIVGKVLLVGGSAVGSGGSFPGDAWLWDGSNWIQLIGAPAFKNPIVAYDQERKVVVVYSSDGNGAQTWTWDGSLWMKRSPAHTPPPRDDGAICYDDRRQTTLLFGGWDGVEALDDTWSWNGVDWSQDHPATVPQARFGAVLSCGSAGVILVGGEVSHSPANDVWTWDGNTWSQQTSSSLPTALSGAAGVFDGSRYLVLLGIRNIGPQQSEVLAYDGSTWTTLTTS